MRGSSENSRPVWVGGIELSDKGEVDRTESPSHRKSTTWPASWCGCMAFRWGSCSCGSRRPALMVRGPGTAAWDALRAPIVRHLESDGINTLGKLELGGSSGRRALSSGGRGPMEETLLDSAHRRGIVLISWPARCCP